MHKNYTCVGVLTCINEAVKETGMTHPSSWIAPCKRIRNPESSKFLLLESGIQRLESGIHNGLESGIHRFRMESGIQKVGIRNPDAGIWNPGPSWILLHGAILDERQIKERRGCWQSLLPLPAFSAAAGESEGGSTSRVSFR